MAESRAGEDRRDRPSRTLVDFMRRIEKVIDKNEIVDDEGEARFVF